MTQTFYWYPKCSTCRKAHRELDTLGISVDEIDLKTAPPTADLIKSWILSSGLDKKKFFNTSGMSYRSLGLKDKVDGMSLDEAAALLASDGMLIKRPILLDTSGKVVQVGYRTTYGELDLK
ncbi:arsenate reductase family protein [Pseudolactococcus insecticola]|uniref:Arsenate reductase family protein n=1 Tax=Pseudolactococcus insecticola TaxID=2709158 RepID=A0A6A0B772_9LACT|nr:arsenate reductase family protein [Lactococcus insecticola]GFH40341.1 arsenate reductase family protein [Lactococcus insecticola]